MTEEEKKEFEEFLKWKAEKAVHAELNKQEEQNKQNDSPSEGKLNVPQQADSTQITMKTGVDAPKDSKARLFITIAAIACILLLLFVLAWNDNKQSSHVETDTDVVASNSEAKYVADNPVSQSNVIKVINRDSIVKVMKKDYNFKRDEFSNTGGCWVEPKIMPKYRNSNSFYCYFWMSDNNIASNLRFVMQYEADDWLFIKDCVFNIDGYNYTYIPRKMERDHDSRIWEWFDDPVDMDNINLVRKIANAKSVKVKLNGRQYYDTRTIKPKEISSIKKTLEFYEEIGNKFN